jgi:hypothetical protein
VKLSGILSLTLTLFFVANTAVCEPAKPESIKQLMRLTGSGELGIQVMNQMLPALKNMVPEAPESFWTDIMDEVNVDEIEAMVIPIYQKYLSEEDIAAINVFYATPAGKKIISVQPSIMQESMMVGQQWGQDLAQRVLQKYQQQIQAQ